MQIGVESERVRKGERERESERERVCVCVCGLQDIEETRNLSLLSSKDIEKHSAKGSADLQGQIQLGDVVLPLHLMIWGGKEQKRKKVLEKCNTKAIN